MRLLLLIIASGCVAEGAVLSTLPGTDAGTPDAGPLEDTSAASDIPLAPCPPGTAGDMDGDEIPDYRDPLPMFCQTPVFQDLFDAAIWETSGDFARDGNEVVGRDGQAFRLLEPAGSYFVEAVLSYEDAGDAEWRLGFALGFARPFDLECELRFEPSRNRDQVPGEVLVFTNVETSRSEMPVFPRFPESSDPILYLQMITLGETTQCRLYDSTGLVGESTVPHNAPFPGPAEDARVLAEGRGARFQSLRGYAL